MTRRLDLQSLAGRPRGPRPLAGDRRPRRADRDGSRHPLRRPSHRRVVAEGTPLRLVDLHVVSEPKGHTTPAVRPEQAAEWILRQTAAILEETEPVSWIRSESRAFRCESVALDKAANFEKIRGLTSRGGGARGRTSWSSPSSARPGTGTCWTWARRKLRRLAEPVPDGPSFAGADPARPASRHHPRCRGHRGRRTREACTTPMWSRCPMEGRFATASSIRSRATTSASGLGVHRVRFAARLPHRRADLLRQQSHRKRPSHRAAGRKSCSPRTRPADAVPAVPDDGAHRPLLWQNRERRSGFASKREFHGDKARGRFMRWLPGPAHDNGMFLVFRQRGRPGRRRGPHRQRDDPRSLRPHSPRDLAGDRRRPGGRRSRPRLHSATRCTGVSSLDQGPPAGTLSAPLAEPTGREVDVRKARFDPEYH